MQYHTTTLKIAGTLALIGTFTAGAAGQGITAKPAPEWTAMFDRDHGWTGAGSGIHRTWT